MLRSALFRLVWLGLLVCLWTHVRPTYADDRVNPIEGTQDTGSDYTLLNNQTPGMVIVLTQEQIRIRGYRTVYEILRDLPGFSTRGSFGESPVTVAMDGEQSQNNEKFLLFVDGVVEQDLWRRSIWLGSQYSVRFIKNFTVFYGPAATRFGANAMSGVIFIDTKKAEDLADGYGDISLTKDIRNGMWSLDLMVGHSYNRRNSPRLAKSLFSWYVRGRLYFSSERNDGYSQRWNPTNQAVAKFIQERVDEYCDDYKRAYNINSPCTDPKLKGALDTYRNNLLNEFTNDRSNSGLYANPSYLNQNQTFALESGFRFDNWFLRFYMWNMATGRANWYPSYRAQTNALWTVRNLSLSLHHLKSELWSSGVGEKARVIYFNLNITYQRHEIPGSSLRVQFLPTKRVFFGQTCYDPTGSNEIPCTWKEYTWQPTYHYVVSSSFRAEPKLDFRLMEGRLKFALGANTGIAFLQGDYVKSNRPNPVQFAQPGSDGGAGNQYERTYFSGFLEGQFAFTPAVIASLGVRSDWELVRGGLEVVSNCQRSLTPCYRYSSPLVGRGSLIALFNDKVKLRLSYGYAFLSPSNWQLFGNALGSEQNSRDLLPQDKHSVEMNIFANVSSKVFLTFSVFHHWLNNVDAIIVLPFRQDESQNSNIGNQTTLGGRLYAIVKPVEYVDVYANLAVLWSRLDVVRDNSDELIQLRDIPLVQANVGVDLRSGPTDVTHFFGSIRMNLQTERQNTGYNQLENGVIEVIRGSTAPLYAILHLSAGFMWIPDESVPILKSLSLSAVAENLLNTTYFDLGIRSGREPNFLPLTPQPGINAYFSLSIGF